MSDCPRCGRDEVLRSQRRLAREIGGRWFTTMITIERCEACDWSPLPVDQIADHERSIATRVALFGPVTNETFRLLRRALNLSAEETAQLINIDAEVIVRIDRGFDAPTIDAWMLLAYAVRDRAASADLPLVTPLGLAYTRSQSPQVQESQDHVSQSLSQSG